MITQHTKLTEFLRFGAVTQVHAKPQLTSRLWQHLTLATLLCISTLAKIPGTCQDGSRMARLLHEEMKIETFCKRRSLAFQSNRYHSAQGVASRSRKPNPTAVSYRVVIDSGSSGSRIWVFRYAGVKVDWIERVKCPVIPEDKFKGDKAFPHLHAFKLNNETQKMETDTSTPKLRKKWDSDTVTLTKYLERLVASTYKYVPENMRPQTTISLYATEGMRTFRDNDEDAAELIIARCTEILNSGKVPYKLNECRIISGGLEAIGAWIDANIQCKDPKMIGEYGVIEIGGASMQIVGDADHKVSLKGWGKDETAKKLWLDDASEDLDMYNDDAKAKSLEKFYEDNPLWNGGVAGQPPAETKSSGLFDYLPGSCWNKRPNFFWEQQKLAAKPPPPTADSSWDTLLKRLRRVCRYGLNSAVVQVSWPEKKRPYKLAGIFKILEKYFDIDTKTPYFEQVKHEGKKSFDTNVANRKKHDDYGNQKHMPFSAALVTYLCEALKFDDHVEAEGTDAQCDVEWVGGLAMMPEFDSNGDKELDAEEVKAIFECAKIQREMEAAV